MSSGSGASNYGYGNITPNSNVNSDYVNIDGSTYTGNFGSNMIPKSIHSLPEPADNIVAASGTWDGSGGRRNNVRNVYKRMKAGKKRSTRTKSLKRFSKTGRRKLHMKKSRKGGKRHTKSRKLRKTRKTHKKHPRKSRKMRKTYRMKGGMGYSQYQSNVPFTPGYAVAGVDVAPTMSATANPPPYETYNHCQDNYNHYDATQGM